MPWLAHAPMLVTSTRRMSHASSPQVGVVCGYPAVGVAKNLLVVDGLDRFEVRRQLQVGAEGQVRAGHVAWVGTLLGWGEACSLLGRGTLVFLLLVGSWETGSAM